MFLPIFLVYPILPFCKVQLIHSECDQKILRLPQFLIRVAVFLPQIQDIISISDLRERVANIMQIRK